MSGWADEQREVFALLCEDFGKTATVDSHMAQVLYLAPGQRYLGGLLSSQAHSFDFLTSDLPGIDQGSIAQIDSLPNLLAATSYTRFRVQEIIPLGDGTTSRATLEKL